MTTTFTAPTDLLQAQSAPSNVLLPLVQLSVVVPTRNESPNVDELIERIRRSMAASGITYEILFIDDSDDGTPATIAAHVADGSPVRLIHRRAGTRAGGLAGALCAGFSDARGSHALCIDADLQHPPELLAPMARVLLDGTADVVVGTRYLAGGDNVGLGGPWRRFVSVASRDLARCTLPQLRQTTDPGSGLFGLKLSVIRGVELKPIGYKTLVEVLARANWSTIAEIPYRFGARNAGTSNVSAREGWGFVRHLIRLKLDTDVRRRRPKTVVPCLAFGVPTADPGDASLLTVVVRRTA